MVARIFRAFSFIIKPVKGGSPPALIRDIRNSLELTCIYLITGVRIRKYIKTNQTSKYPDNLKIQPIWTIPEKITTKIGLDRLNMVAEATQTLSTLSISFAKRVKAIKEIGATFCHVWIT